MYVIGNVNVWLISTLSMHVDLCVIFEISKYQLKENQIEEDTISK
jgi:hypothetical protein